MSPAFEQLFKFLMADELQLDGFNDYVELAKLADEYLIPSLLAVCERYLLRVLDEACAVDCSCCPVRFDYRACLMLRDAWLLRISTRLPSIKRRTKSSFRLPRPRPAGR
eukprot:TRINITY_DN30856_c0_g1_i1.p5 TRINITY_DN30856_c0_g1~~TRINITY_DN30856_c0_g1_i1.p5  ORF type:complete len:109 (+),score=11.21 TRINITY_DN30856_c0_g1_i1:975-1301(+)